MFLFLSSRYLGMELMGHVAILFNLWIKKKKNYLLIFSGLHTNTHGTIDWFKVGKRIYQGCICHSTYLMYIQSTLYESWTGWLKAGIKIAGRNINNFRYAHDTTLMPESEEELKSLLKVKESEKVGLNYNIQKMKIMASDPIISWELAGEKVETVSDFIFLGSKINIDGDCSPEIKRCLLLERKAMPNLDSILKSRNIISPQRSI